jgi:hypothetical protein
MFIHNSTIVRQASAGSIILFANSSVGKKSRKNFYSKNSLFNIQNRKFSTSPVLFSNKNTDFEIYDLSIPGFLTRDIILQFIEGF